MGTVVGANAEFKRRVVEQYPLPMGEVELVKLLEKQGFEISGDRKIASFKEQNMVCTQIWDIWWAADMGKVVKIEGQFTRYCL